MESTATLTDGAASPEAGQESRLLVIRHGETSWNIEGRIQGQLDTQLSELGRAQAKSAGKALQRLGLAAKVDAIVSSDLSRAIETADIISEVCPEGTRRHIPGLREVNFGAIQGKLNDEVRAEKETIYRAWLRGNFEPAYPEGESAADVIERGMQSLREAAQAGSCVVVVTHGGLKRWCSIAIELKEQPSSPQLMASKKMTQLLRAHIRNCCCSTVVYDKTADRFRSEGWFQDLGELSACARDDTG